MDNYTTLIMLTLMVLAFYFLILRPQKKRQQAIQQTLGSLTPGTRVLLGSGLFGTIVAIGDRQAVLEISPGVELTVLKQAIIRAATEADEDTVISDDLDDLDDVQPEVVAPALDAQRTDPQRTDPQRTDPQRPTPSAGADSSRLG